MTFITSGLEHPRLAGLLPGLPFRFPCGITVSPHPSPDPSRWAAINRWRAEIDEQFHLYAGGTPLPEEATDGDPDKMPPNSKILNWKRDFQVPLEDFPWLAPSAQTPDFRRRLDSSLEGAPLWLKDSVTSALRPDGGFRWDEFTRWHNNGLSRNKDIVNDALDGLQPPARPWERALMMAMVMQESERMMESEHDANKYGDAANYTPFNVNRCFVATVDPAAIPLLEAIQNDRSTSDEQKTALTLRLGVELVHKGIQKYGPDWVLTLHRSGRSTFLDQQNLDRLLQDPDPALRTPEKVALRTREQMDRQFPWLLTGPYVDGVQAETALILLGSLYPGSSVDLMHRPHKFAHSITHT